MNKTRLIAPLFIASTRDDSNFERNLALNFKGWTNFVDEYIGRTSLVYMEYLFIDMLRNSHPTQLVLRITSFKQGQCPSLIGLIFIFDKNLNLKSLLCFLL